MLEKSYKRTGYDKKCEQQVRGKDHKFRKNQAKGEQYSPRNNVELSDIPNSIRDEDLENTVINICKE